MFQIPLFFPSEDANLDKTILTSCKNISLISKNAAVEILLEFKRSANYKKNATNCQMPEKFCNYRLGTNSYMSASYFNNYEIN